MAMKRDLFNLRIRRIYAISIYIMYIVNNKNFDISILNYYFHFYHILEGIHLLLQCNLFCTLGV